jgi:ribosomal protein L11 methyltransferase
MAWTELSLDATSEAVDWISTLLSTIEYGGEITVTPYQSESEADRPIALQHSPSAADDGSDSEPNWAFTIYLYLPEQVSQADIDRIASLLLPLHRTGMATDLRWADVDEQHRLIQPLDPCIHRIGQRFVVLAPNSAYQHPTRDIPLILETSRSFGSGLHPTTMVSLRLLERHVIPNMYGLDLGSGTGILSVAMAKMGARVLALDNDRLAVQATQAAVSLNHVEQTVAVIEGSLGQGSELGHWMGGETIGPVSTVEPKGAFDLIIANILPWIHIKLASDFQQALRPTSPHRLLLTAGYTTEYEPEVLTALAEVGFQPIDRDQQDEWVGLAFRLEQSPETNLP